ncbi:hypothetical protein HYH03_012081 [Edaphochlamys debaryana]|uniref:MYND-type domain-containing protein n=1 Tax=Edaphochlamys debaryana TaxID=47281 RepID=A0A836BUI4_9CHLO|nr:hypothetical protein HYH03_012081 [Edaphochlamys debaryana]|eukprot:KAG2489445.1 hypothetical protein HYH03_012081 [Edaphochlamys debaryana]
MVAFEALTTVSCLTHALDQPIPSSASAVAFVRTLLRTHTLERLSRACAAATACIQELCVAITEAGAAVAAPWEGYLFDCQRTLGAVASLIPRLAAVGQRAAAVPLPAPPPPISAADRDGYSARHRQWKRLEVAKRVLVSELVSHLATSGALEMMARAQLTVGIATSAALEAEDHDTARELQNVGMTNLHLYLQVLVGVVALCRAVSPDAAATLRGAMSGPCFRHLVLSAALAALCAADEGPCYGLPDALLDGLPVMGSAREAPNRLVRDVRSLQDQGVAVWLGPSIFGSVIKYLHLTALQITAVAGAPRMLLDLLLRMGGLAVESARMWADADAAAEADDEGRLLLDPDRSEEAVALVCECLFESDQLLWGHASGGWAEASLLGRWRLAVGAIRHMAPWLNAEKRDVLATLVAGPLGADELDGSDDEPGSLPPAPSPTVAAALAAGLVPALENLLRRAGQAHAAAVLAHVLMTIVGSTSVSLMHLFAYAPAVELASLFASVAKLLRRCQVRASRLPEYWRRGGDWDCVLGVTLQSFAAAPHQSLRAFLAAVCPSGGPEHAASAAASPRAAATACPSHRRLTTALAASAVLWLPELSRLARGWLAAVNDPWGPSSQAQEAPETKTLPIMLLSPLMWLGFLPFLLGSDGGPEGASTAECGAGSGGGGAGSGGGSSGGGGWRRFLVEEVGAVPLLAAALRLAPKWRPTGGGSAHAVDVSMTRLVTACAAVAVAAPEAVRRAALAGAAASSAGSAARNRRRGPPSSGAQEGAAWHPQHFEDLASKTADAPGIAGLALAVGAVVTQWRHGGTVTELHLSKLREGLRTLQNEMCAFDIQSSARALPSLEEARAMLPPTCAFPGCACLQGDSEAGLGLAGYAEGAAGAVYCSRGCATQHTGAGLRARGRG